MVSLIVLIVYVFLEKTSAPSVSIKGYNRSLMEANATAPLIFFLKHSRGVSQVHTASGSGRKDTVCVFGIASRSQGPVSVV